MQRWFDELGVSVRLRPQHVNWQPDYDAYYIDQLRRNATTWFLFRREFLFVMPRVLVSEVPESGHATYIFAKPANLDTFLPATLRPLARTSGTTAPTAAAISDSSAGSCAAIERSAG